MQPQPTAIELLARQHRTDRLAAAAQPRSARRSAPRAASVAVEAWLSGLRRALRPAPQTAAPCCA